MPTPIVNADRDREILIKRDSGATLAGIGALHGISRQRVHAIIKAAHPGHQLDLLTTDRFNAPKISAPLDSGTR